MKKTKPLQDFSEKGKQIDLWDLGREIKRNKGRKAKLIVRAGRQFVAVHL